MKLVTVSFFFEKYVKSFPVCEVSAALCVPFLDPHMSDYVHIIPDCDLPVERVDIHITDAEAVVGKIADVLA